MLRVKWLEGEAEGYTDLLPDDVLSPIPATVLIHNVIGPRGGSYLAKCRTNQIDANIDLDYNAFAHFNDNHEMERGTMRLAIRDGQPFEMHWKSPEGSFARVRAELIFEPGKSLTEFDIDQIKNNGSSPTETLQLINARRGQGNFRANLQIRWSGQCALTGITHDAILRASHIKPWATCKPRERIDSSNGFLLAAHVDALFDKYLITFGKEGQLIWSSSVSDADQEALALPKKLRLELSSEEKRYLTYHNQVASM